MRASGALLSTVLVVGCFVLWLGTRGLHASASSARANWPAAVQLPVVPALAPVLRGLLGRELTADTLWCRALVYYGSARAETGDYRHLEEYIDAILDTDPHFYRVYRWAAYAVTFKAETATQEEYRMSIRYLERAMEVLADDYEVFWLAGLRYYLDLHSEDPDERRRFRERGADLIRQAVHKPNAPPDLATLAAHLQSQLGRQEIAMAGLREMILTTDNPRAQERMLNMLQGLAQSREVAEELIRIRREFEREWKAEHPLVPPALYVLLGPRPPPAIDLAIAADPPELTLLEPEPGGRDDARDDSSRPSPHGPVSPMP